MTLEQLQKLSDMEGAIFDISVHLNQVKLADPVVRGKEGLEEINGLLASCRRATSLLKKDSSSL